MTEYEVKGCTGIGAEWDFAKNQRMEYYIADEISSCRNVKFTEVILKSGSLLKYKKLGNYLYELVLELFSDKSDLFTVKSLLKELVHSVPIYDYVVEVRYILASEDRFGADVLSALMRISALILQAYNLGKLVGVVSNSKQVLFGNSLDPLELSLICAIEVSRRKEVNKRMQGYKEMYGSDVTRYLRYLRTVDHADVLGQFQSVDDEKFVEVANNIMSSMVYSYANNLFNEVDSYFFPTYDYMQTLGWEREQTVNPSSHLIQLFMLITENLLKKDVLKTRKFFIREKGVAIVFDTPQGDIKRIEVREYHSPDNALYEEHYLNFYYSMTTGETRFFFVNMKDLVSSHIPLLYEKDAEVLLMLMSWMGIFSEMKVTPKEISTVKSIRDVGASSKDFVLIARSVAELVRFITKQMNSDNYYYETPTQWNYELSGSNKGKAKSVLNKPARLIKVGRYTRRLPAGQNVSVEAQALAKRYFIELKSGYTIVDEFERLQRK